jgi:hypothetical protein
MCLIQVNLLLNILFRLPAFPICIGRGVLDCSGINFEASHKPDKIILWYAVNNSKLLEELPQVLLNQQKKRFDIKICQG